MKQTPYTSTRTAVLEPEFEGSGWAMVSIIPINTNRNAYYLGLAEEVLRSDRKGSPVQAVPTQAGANCLKTAPQISRFAAAPNQMTATRSSIQQSKIERS
jgi:hypothetical protein